MYVNMTALSLSLSRPSSSVPPILLLSLRLSIASFVTTNDTDIPEILQTIVCARNHGRWLGGLENGYEGG